MVLHLVTHCLIHPTTIRSARLIWTFRRHYERFAVEGTGDRAAGYVLAASQLGISVKRVQEVIEDWMLVVPLRYIRACRFPFVAEFMSELRRRSIKIGVLSDYPSERKLCALELNAEAVIDAGSEEVAAPKPHPKGLLMICEQFEVEPSNVLFIGDREDRDAEAARRAGAHYLLKTAHRPYGPYFSSYQDLLNSLKATA